MQIKSIESILEEANKQIKRLSFDESIDLIENHKLSLLMLERNLKCINSGLIKDAIHIPRGLIEFKSADISSLIDNETYILVYCAGGYRSALAAKTLKDIGFNSVFNIGGYEEWIQNGGEIQPSL